jgi:hypothetical protein
MSIFSALCSLQFGFVIFWQQNFSAKAACKMLIKLTLGVNFIIVLCANFGQLFSSLSLALKFFGKKILAQKLLVKC